MPQLTDDRSLGAQAAESLIRGLGRRGFLRAAAGLGTAGALSLSGGSALASAPGPAAPLPAGPAGGGGPVLQPHTGEILGQHYLTSEVEDVLWGYVPTVHARPVATVRSGETVTIDAVSHEGIMEDQGRDPYAFFAGHGVGADQVLSDAAAIAAGYARTPRDFDLDGPHVVTGPIAVQGAEPGDVLKVETLDARPRVPYGVVSSRHGKGALGLRPDGTPPAGIGEDEVMPPTALDGRGSGDPLEYGNLSVFTAIEGDRGVMRSGQARLSFPLRPFFGMMGVAVADAPGLTDPTANSIPPTLGGGNIDIRHLGVGSALYLPVSAEGALFYVGDPHMAMGDGEVALTAVEGSLRGTFRLTVCKRGSGEAPSVAYSYPFGETDEHWIPTGLSDPDGAAGPEQNTDLNVAMRRAVVNALDFLEHDRGIERGVAYAYLSAAADFSLSQVVDRTTGVHGLIRKADLLA
jgi:acetamidase/formamidase